jgi:hypothetical protein
MQLTFVSPSQVPLATPRLEAGIAQRWSSTLTLSYFADRSLLPYKPTHMQ